MKKHKNDVIYTDDNIDDICKKLNIEVKYDYENQKIYINL